MDRHQINETARPRVVDNDRGEITVTLDGKEIRGWWYADEAERRIKMLAAREFCEGWLQCHERANVTEICKELGCTQAQGVALRFVKELRRDLRRADERQVELLRTWDTASPTERQELDRLRRGWGPSTPTERMARLTDLRAAMHIIGSAMQDVVPDEEIEEDDLTFDHFNAAYDKLLKGYGEISNLIREIPELAEPTVEEVAS